MKVAPGRAEKEAQRPWEPAIQEGFLEKDALLELGNGWAHRGPSTGPRVTTGVELRVALWGVGSVELRIVGAGKASRLGARWASFLILEKGWTRFSVLPEPLTPSLAHAPLPFLWAN